LCQSAPSAPIELPAAQAEVDLAAARRDYRFFRRLAILTLMLSSAIALSLNLVDPDLWGHVLYGQELLAEGTLPTTATHTFTAPDHRWINHENLAEIAFALGFAHLGVYPMLALKCLWGMSILGLMVWAARRRGVDTLVAWGIMLLIANNLIAFFPMRPQLLSFMCFALLLVVLDRAFAAWDERRVEVKWLLLTPLLFVVWANSHGAFLAGLCIFGVYLAGRGIELLVAHGKAAWPTVLQMAGVGIAAALATLLNPYGPDLLVWLVHSLGTPRPEITEWLPPTPDTPVFMPLLLLVGVMVVSLAASRERRDWTQIAILALITWQAFSHLRHIALLALLCGFWLPVHLQSAAARLRPAGAHKLPVMRLSPWLAGVTTIALAATVGLMAVDLSDRLTSFPVARDRYPVDAIDFMARHQLKGRMVASFNWAQYTIAALSPDVEVAFDGRFRTCYPQEIVDMHFDFLLGENDGRRARSPNSGPIDGHRVLSYGHPNLVLVDRAYEDAEQVMYAESLRTEPEWTLLYQDATAQLWGLRRMVDDPASEHYFDPNERFFTRRVFNSSETWPALPARRASGKLAGPATVRGGTVGQTAVDRVDSSQLPENVAF
jgi:hypothetical protein